MTRRQAIFLLFLATCGLVSGASAGSGVDSTHPPARPIPGWLVSLPFDLPVPLVLGAGGGLPGTDLALETARERAAEAMTRRLGVTVDIARTLEHSSRGALIRDDSRIEASSPAPLSSDAVTCIDQFEDTLRGVTWCLAARASDAELDATHSIVRRLQQPAAYSVRRPPWLQATPHQGGWLFAAGFAPLQVQASTQLRVAEDRAVRALGEQVEVHLATRTRSFHTSGLQLFKRRTDQVGQVGLREVRTVATWRSREADGLWVLVAGRAAGR